MCFIISLFTSKRYNLKKTKSRVGENGNKIPRCSFGGEKVIAGKNKSLLGGKSHHWKKKSLLGEIVTCTEGGPPSLQGVR